MCAFSPQCDQKAKNNLNLSSLLPLEKKLKSLSSTQSRKIILLAGPTACGKTALSLLLAELLNGEIVSADSMQVYRGMDIGTAKVDLKVRAKIPHHLIDIREIDQPFNVVDFYYESKQSCESILARDRVPIVVGGSGFYFRALLYGPPSGPPSMPDLRINLEEEMQSKGQEAMFQKVKELDPDYARTITPNDRHKVIRALEIMTLTGQKVSGIGWERHQPLPDFAYHCWFIHKPRTLLYPTIEARCEQMLERGLLDEVRLLEKQGLRSNTSASQAIGYRQCLDYLESACDPESYAKFVKEFKAASRHFAKRQFTWFRKEPLFEWLDVDRHDLETAAEIIASDYLASR